MTAALDTTLAQPVDRPCQCRPSLAPFAVRDDDRRDIQSPEALEESLSLAGPHGLVADHHQPSVSGEGSQVRASAVQKAVVDEQRVAPLAEGGFEHPHEIGRASCRERVCPYG